MPHSPAPVGQADTEAGLRQIGVGAGGTLLVHSSPRSFGRVDGGAEAVIAALQAVVTARGALVMPTLTLGADEDRVLFDVRRSPSASGHITSVFRQGEGVHRSRHPFSSAAAWGWGARELTAHDEHFPCSLTSHYRQVYFRGGYSLFMGATLQSNTIFHVAEELERPAYLRYAAFPDASVIDEQGRRLPVTAYRYNRYQTGIRRRLGNMETVFRHEGVLREVVVGQWRRLLLWAPDNVEHSRQALRRRPELILEDGSDH